MLCIDYLNNMHWFFIILFWIGLYSIRYRKDYYDLTPSQRLKTSNGLLMVISCVGLLILFSRMIEKLLL